MMNGMYALFERARERSNVLANEWASELAYERANERAGERANGQFVDESIAANSTTELIFAVISLRRISLGLSATGLNLERREIDRNKSFN